MTLHCVLRSLAVAALFGLTTFSAQSAEAQQGSLTGRVTDVTSGQPVALAQITISGTNLGTQTDADGRFTLRGAGPGPIEIRILRVGYAELRQAARLEAGQTTTMDFRMIAVPVSLSPVVSTATGDQRRVEVGNAIAQVDAANIVETRAVTNLGDVLTARTPGVQVLP